MQKYKGFATAMARRYWVVVALLASVLHSSISLFSLEGLPVWHVLRKLNGMRLMQKDLHPLLHFQFSQAWIGKKVETASDFNSEYCLLENT